MAAKPIITPERVPDTLPPELAALIDLQRQTAALEMAALMELVAC